MGNCLDKSYSSSDESDDNTVDSRAREANEIDDENGVISSDRRNRTNRSYHNHRTHRSSSSNRYTNLIEEATSSASSLSSSTLNSSSQHRHNNNHNHHHNHHHHHHRSRSRTMLDGNSLFSGNQNLNRVNCLSHSLNNGNRSASLGVPFSSSVPVSGAGLVDLSPSSVLTAASPSQQVFYLTPNTQRTVDQLTEEEQIKLLKRMTLIQQLPTGSFDENKKHKECVICMIDFEKNDTIKYLPCMHTFHQSCIDTWLLRSLICPSCMEPVDAGLLAAYE